MTLDAGTHGLWLKISGVSEWVGSGHMMRLRPRTACTNRRRRVVGSP